MGPQIEHAVAAPSKIVLDSDVSEIRLLLQEYAGVVIDRPTEIIAGLLQALLASHNFSSMAELISAMRGRRAQCDALLEILLPGESSFFRSPELFEIFKREAMPAIQERKRAEAGRPLRIWSAGCGTGEEAYSIGISVCEALNHDTEGCWNVHIVASDIRREALKIAERGLYPAKSLLAMPARLVANYFSRVGDHFLVKPRLRNLVTFTHMNLIEPAFIGRFDCIFCLDVLPHLSASGRTALWQRLHLALEPGGYLFIGQNDHLSADTSFIRLTAADCTYYQRPLAAAARAGR